MHIMFQGMDPEGLCDRLGGGFVFCDVRTIVLNVETIILNLSQLFKTVACPCPLVTS